MKRSGLCGFRGGAHGCRMHRNGVGDAIRKEHQFDLDRYRKGSTPRLVASVTLVKSP